MPRIVLRLLVLCIAAASVAAGCADRPPLVTGSATEAPYILGSGDRLRITVFNQPTLSASYSVDANGRISMPLLGSVEAGGYSTYELKRTIEARLAKDYLRDPNVSVEVESYRPFFIFGEVAQGGQYPFVAGMTAEQAVAIAGGYTPRAQQERVDLARRDSAGVVRVMVPMTTIIRPGDTIFVKERWF
jgi:polysaccharide export outer membrane protein